MTNNPTEIDHEPMKEVAKKWAKLGERCLEFSNRTYPAVVAFDRAKRILLLVDELERTLRDLKRT